MTVPNIRQADATDASAISELLAALGYPASIFEVSERITKCTATPDSNVFVAEADDLVVGVASFHRIPLLHADGFVGRITSLFVASSHRKRGVGRALIATVEEYGWRLGCIRMEVTSGDHRPEAHTFYERVGYRQDCRRFLKQKPEVPNLSSQSTQADDPHS